MAPRIPSDSTVGSSSHASSHMDVDEGLETSSRRSSLTNVSIHEDHQQNLEERFDLLSSTLSALRLDAQHQLNLQPKRTQLALSTQTRAIFSEYGRHGSEARLSQSVKEYLNDRNNTKDMVLWSPKDAAAAEKAANERMASLKLLTTVRAYEAAQREAIAKGENPALIDPKFVPNGDINNSPLDGRKTEINDEESLQLLQEMDFEPANIQLSFPEEMSGNIPPEILSTTNKILHLLNLQANARLDHHVAKYITLSPTPLKTRNGYVLLRAGLHEEYTQTVSNLFATEDSNNDGFGFNQAERSWLRECYDHMGVKREGGKEGEMTERERTLVANAVGVHEEAVEGWWGAREGVVRGRKGMAVWVRARELEAIRKAKLEGRW